MTTHVDTETPTSTAQHTLGRLSHIPALDGLRGLSVLAVVLYHFDDRILAGGFLGVSVFFTLSGFLISRILLHEAETTGTISVRRFFDRRFRRLLPAASLAIIGTSAWVLASGRRHLLPAGDVRSSALWHFNWHELSKDISYGAADSSALGHFWSLAIEEQFYFVYPVIILGLLRVNKRCVRPAILGAAIVSILLASMLDSYYNTFSRSFEILAGCAAATHSTAKIRGSLATSGPLVALIALMALTTLPTGGELPTIAVFLTAGATVMIIHASQTTGGHPILTHPVLRTLGTYSYSIYLWHWPVFVLVDNALIRIALTVLLSVGSYHLVEQPIRRTKGSS